MNMMLYWIGFFIVLGLSVGIVYFARKKSKKGSAKTEGKISRILRQMALLRSWKVLDHVTISDGTDSAEISHAVVGPFGVLLLNDLYQVGSIYGEADAEEWILSDEDSEGNTNGKERIPNPLLPCRKAEALLRKKMAEQKIYKVQVETAVIKTVDQASYINGARGMVLDRKELKDLLSSPKYEKDQGVQIDSVVELLK